MKLNKRSVQPLYAQLKDLLSERIESGTYQPQDKIPSEMELCRELSLSRPTVRQAIAELVSEGYLEIHKGRGTFVASEPQRIELKNFSPLTFSLLAAKSLDGFSQLTASSRQGDPDTDRRFGIEGGAGHPGYWAVGWQIGSEDTLIGSCEALIPVYMFPKLGDDLRAGRRMIDITANKYAYLPQRASASLIVRTPASQEASLLDIDRTVPLYQITSRLRSRSGNCCEIITALLRTDRITLNFDAGRS